MLEVGDLIGLAGFSFVDVLLQLCRISCRILFNDGVVLFAFRGESGLTFQEVLVGCDLSFIVDGIAGVSGVLWVLKDGEECSFIICRRLETASRRWLIEADDIVLFKFRGESGLTFEGALIGSDFSFIVGGITGVSGVLWVLKDDEECSFIIWRLLDTASR